MLLEYSNINFKNNNSNCIILVGSPGSGKSTFCKNYLSTIFNNIKKQDFDRFVEYYMKYNNLDAKNPNNVNLVHDNPNINKIYKILRNTFFDGIKSTDNVLFDVSGRETKYVREIVDICSLNGIKNFTLVWVLVDLPMAIDRNTQRDRTVDYSFLEKCYFGVKNNLPEYYKQFNDFQVVVNTEPNLENNILWVKSDKVSNAELNFKNKTFYEKQGMPSFELSENPISYVESVQNILNYEYLKNNKIQEVMSFEKFIKNIKLN